MFVTWEWTEMGNTDIERVEQDVIAGCSILIKLSRDAKKKKEQTREGQSPTAPERCFVNFGSQPESAWGILLQTLL